MAAPLVSVCIPTYNAGPYIADTIRSVLGQTLRDFEVIVSDDRSTDATLEVVRSFDDERITVLENDENLGPAGNWNRAVAAASGEYVKLLCHDDLLYPTCLERQVDALKQAGEGAVLAASPRDIIDARGGIVLRAWSMARMRGRVPGDVAIRRAVRSGTTPFGEPVSVLLRASALAAAGPFSAQVQYVIDLDMWVRVLRHGDLCAVDETAGAFRVSDESWSAELAHKQHAHIRALFARLHRECPDVVRRSDYVIGWAKAPVLSAGRRLVYLLLRARMARAS